jgi:diadenosine tetraphosphate (Ap4A) HIT family hydrolase
VDETFVLHEKLDADTMLVADWPVARVLLMNDANYPWLILVPRRAGLRDYHDVASEDEVALLGEVNKASRILKKITGAGKMNIGALGNMVPQLHIHVIARFETDAAWPDPVWGKHAAVAYEAGAGEVLIEKFNTAAKEF